MDSCKALPVLLFAHMAQGQSWFLLNWSKWKVK